MKRRLIKQGGGGYTIYLPKKWVDKKGLSEKEEIDIIETDTALIIGSDIKKKNEITIELDRDNKKEIRPLLTHAYRKGFDIITLKNVDNKSLKETKRIAKDLLLGFEVSNIEDTVCRIENISEPSDEKYDSVLRRIFLIVKETQQIILSDFEKSRFDNLAEVSELRNQQDKLILFCRRILIKEKYEKNPVINWELLTFLMHIEHTYFYLYKYSSENGAKCNEGIISMLKALEECYDSYYNYYYKKDEKYIQNIYKMRDEFLYNKIFRALEKSRGKETVVLSYIRELFRLIQIGTSPIRSIILD